MYNLIYNLISAISAQSVFLNKDWMSCHEVWYQMIYPDGFDDKFNMKPHEMITYCKITIIFN